MYKAITGNDATKVEYEPDDTDHAVCEKLKEIAQKIVWFFVSGKPLAASRQQGYITD